MEDSHNKVFAPGATACFAAMAEPTPRTGAGHWGTSSNSTEEPGTGRSCSDLGRIDDEEDWPENPWQAHANAHVEKLRQVDRGDAAFGIPTLLCDLALKTSSGPRTATCAAWNDVAIQGRHVGNGDSCDEPFPSRNELEGQIAVYEDALAKRDHELRKLQARLKIAEERGQGAAGSEAEAKAQRQANDELRRRNEFLDGIVSRFERKTMVLEQQVAKLSRRESELEARAKAADRLQLELNESKSELEARRKAEEEASARHDRLLSEQQRLLEKCAEHQQASEGAQIKLKEAKREHNRKVQELLHRVQVQEKRQQNATERQTDRRPGSASSISCPQARMQAAKECQTDTLLPESPELRELKELNVQLIERLAQERTAHAEMTGKLEAVHQESEAVNQRLSALTEQLCHMAELNDRLQEELDVANAACCAAATGKLNLEHLDSMS